MFCDHIGNYNCDRLPLSSLGMRFASVEACEFVGIRANRREAFGVLSSGKQARQLYIRRAGRGARVETRHPPRAGESQRRERTHLGEHLRNNISLRRNRI
jgi:hypothetical protein